MRNKILVLVVALAGFASLVAIPATSAQAATGTPPSELCAPGTTVIAYCTAYCPSGTLVGAYCEVVPSTPVTPSKVVLPEGRPTVSHELFWDAKRARLHGPALEFDLKRGINDAPLLKSFKVTLPGGLTFVKKKFNRAASFGVLKLRATKHTLIITLRTGLPTFDVFLKKGSMHESNALREQLDRRVLRFVTIHVTVTDTTGRVTHLSFKVKPRS